MKKITSQVKSISRVFAFAPKKILFAFMLMVIITMTSFAQRAMEVKLTGDGLIANPMTLVEYQNQTARSHSKGRPYAGPIQHRYHAVLDQMPHRLSRLPRLICPRPLCVQARAGYW